MNDNFNGKNNLATVKKSDFEVMDALENDANQPCPNKTLQSNQWQPKSICSIFLVIFSFSKTLR